MYYQAAAAFGEFNLSICSARWEDMAAFSGSERMFGHKGTLWAHKNHSDWLEEVLAALCVDYFKIKFSALFL